MLKFKKNLPMYIMSGKCNIFIRNVAFFMHKRQQINQYNYFYIIEIKQAHFLNSIPTNILISTGTFFKKCAFSFLSYFTAPA